MWEEVLAIIKEECELSSTQIEMFTEVWKRKYGTGLLMSSDFAIINDKFNKAAEIYTIKNLELLLEDIGKTAISVKVGKNEVLRKRGINAVVVEIISEADNIIGAKCVYDLATSENYYLYCEKNKNGKMSRLEALSKAVGEQQLKYALEFDGNYGIDYSYLTKIIGNAKNERRSLYAYQLADIYAMISVYDETLAEEVYSRDEFLNDLNAISGVCQKELVSYLFKAMLNRLLTLSLLVFNELSVETWKVMKNGDAVTAKEIISSTLKLLTNSKKRERQIHDEVSDN